MSTWDCVDCGADTVELCEYYMVTDSCWVRAGMDDGCICIGCLEKRLGKRLAPRNFLECPLNWRNALIPGYGSQRLISRLFGSKTSKWAKGALELLDDFYKSQDEDAFNKKVFELTLLDHHCLEEAH